MNTKDIHFAEKVSDVVKLHGWDISKARFLGFAVINIDNADQPVCLLVLPDGYKYHTMDGSEHQATGRLKYKPLKYGTDHGRVFTDKNIRAVMQIKDGFTSWTLSHVDTSTASLQESPATLAPAE